MQNNLPHPSQAPDFAIDLSGNGSFLFDPRELFSSEFSLSDTKLYAKLVTEITQTIWDQSQKEGLLNKLLLSKTYIASELSYAISMVDLVRYVKQKEIKGFYRCEKLSPFILGRKTESLKYNKDISITGKIKNSFALYGQKFLLFIQSIFNKNNLIITLSNYNVSYMKSYGKILLLRRPNVFFGRKCKLTKQVELDIQSTFDDLLTQIDKILLKHQLTLDQKNYSILRSYILNELEAIYMDYKFLKWFFGKRKFSFFCGTCVSYRSGLFAFLAQESGGKAYMIYHGYGTFGHTEEPNCTELLKGTTILMSSKMLIEDGESLKAFLPKGAKTSTFELLQESPFKKYTPYTLPKKQIKHVAVMDLSAPRLSLLSYVYLGVNLSNFLADAGFIVTYKVHPESSWKRFDSILSKNINIEERKYEEVYEQYDAIIYLENVSSTLAMNLGSNKFIFAPEDGWHEKFWIPRVDKALRKRCIYFPATIKENGLHEIDKEYLLEKLKNPPPFDYTGFYEFIGMENQSEQVLCT